MSEGYQDFYVPMALTWIAPEITIPVNIKGTEVIIEVKITGSDVTLDVNVTNPNINVVITGSQVTLDVNIKSSVTLNVNITDVSSDVVVNVNIKSSEITLNVQITGSTVTLDVNIKSQEVTLNVNIESVGSEVVFNVNIKSQSVDIGVVIKSSDVTLDVNVINSVLNVNVGSIPFETASENILENPGFETGDLTGWSVIGNGSAEVQSDVVFKGSYAVKLTPNANTWVAVRTTKFYPCQPGQKILVTGVMRRDANITKLGFYIDFYSSEKSWIAATADYKTPDPDTWTKVTSVFEVPDGACYFRVLLVAFSGDTSGNAYFDSLHVPRIVLLGSSTEIPVSINIASQSVTMDVNIKSSEITLNVQITGSTVTLDVNIKSSEVTLNVNIASQDVDLNVKITGQEVTLNVKVEGTANVNIANAEVYLNVSQDEVFPPEIVTEDSTPSNYVSLSANTRYGFFVKNVRCFIAAMWIWFRNNSGSDITVTVRIKLEPDGPTLREGTKTIPNGTDGFVQIIGDNGIWAGFWNNYDVLFFEIIPESDGLEVGTGTAKLHYYTGSYWTGYYTIALKINRWGIGKGIIPISGTVNTIQIPNVAARWLTEGDQLNPYIEKTIATIQGTGRVLWIGFVATGTGASSAELKVYTDGNQVFGLGISWWHFFFDDSKAGIGVRVTKYDTNNDIYSLMLTIPFEFRKSLKIAVKNHSNDTITISVIVIYTLIK